MCGKDGGGAAGPHRPGSMKIKERPAACNIYSSIWHPALSREQEISAVTCYRVSFFKNLLSPDGHPFQCLQHVIEVRHARSVDRAILAAERRYERLHHVHNWELYADMIEIEIRPRGALQPWPRPAIRRMEG